MNATSMAKSLGFYVHVKRLAGVAQADFERVDDYHDFLADGVATAQLGAAIAGFGNENPLLPLDEITLTQIQYGDIVGQIFAGVSFITLSLPHPPPQVPVVQNNVSYFDNYIESLDGGKGDPRTKADVESIVDRMNSLLAEREANEQRVNGLVVGRVQSGKTRNYVGLMLKAVDEGWNVIIVLTSSNTALADQTEDRIKDDFAKAEVYTQIALNFRGNDTVAAPMHLLAPGNTSFYWGVAMKESHNLDNILGWLHQHEDMTSHMRILVIDDEADNATPDSNMGRNNQLTEGEVEDLIAVVRETEIDGKTYANLADWMVGIQDVILDKQEQAECDPGSKEDVALDVLRTKLMQSGGTAQKRLAGILGNENICDLLDLNEHEVEGVLVNFKQDILLHFNGSGKGPRSAATFLRFLNTILEVAVERSAINRRICELIARKPNSTDYTFAFARCAYVAYTATPYANILNERPDQTPLYADFIKSLAVSPKYFGLDKIFGRDCVNHPLVPNMNIVDAIGGDDKRFVLNPIQEILDAEKKEVLEVNLSNDLRYTCINPSKEGAWVSMVRAIAWVFCSGGARRHNRISNNRTKLDDRWTTMMVNISPKQDAHDSLLVRIKSYLGIRCGTLEAKGQFLEECRNTWEHFTTEGNSAYTKVDFDNAFNSDNSEKYGEIADYPSWEEIRDDVRYFIDGWNDIRVHAIIVNSANEKNKDNQNRYNQTGNHANTLSDDHLWIVIGGNTIGRGLTLRGLTASYFDRVRKTVAVDTMTQMGRWFGYRLGYELLPRIWMPAETVLELQRTAFIEGDMHERMKENFDAGYSPSDPGHYLMIYSWGRTLTHKRRAQRMFMKSIGTLSTSDDISVKPEDISAIYEAALSFIGSLGQQMDRSGDEYVYPELPVWADVDKNVVKNYIKCIIPHYPEGARQKLRALIREINETEEKVPGDTKWHVVIGEPKTSAGKSYPIGVGRDIFSGKPKKFKVIGDVARYGSVRSDRAFYAMITKRRINYTEAVLVEHDRAEVIGTIKDKVEGNNGQVPAVIESALANYPGATLETRLDAMVQAIKDDSSISVPAAIRDCLPEGFRNRSAIEYREEVYANAGHVQPILQLYLLTPPVGPTEKPLIAHAFYWPNHSPDDFSLVTIGMEPNSHNPSEQRFGETVADILAQNGFPMPVSKLKAAVLSALPDCSEEFFNTHIKHPLHGIKYAKVSGKNAYYHTDWALDPVAKIRHFVLERAAEILGDHQARAYKELAQTVLADNPALEGLFNPNSSQERNAVFADENLPQFGIVKNEDGTLQIQ